MQELECLAKRITCSLQGMTFFVGAGISVDSDLPSFAELNKSILKAITSKFPDEISQLRSEVILQTLSSELGSEADVRYLSFFEMFHDKRYVPNINHFLIAEVLRQGGKVVTTNWDNLIERACQNRGIPYRVCSSVKDYEDFIKNGPAHGCSYIFKLHGNLDGNNPSNKYESILMTLEDVARGLNEYKRRFLEQCLQDDNFCFMGYSGMDDFDILPVLINTQSEKEIIWIKHDEKNNDMMTGEAIADELKKIQYTNKNYQNVINVNRILLTRKKCSKVRTVTSCFSAKILSQPYAKDTDVKKDRHGPRYQLSPEFDSFADSITQNKRDFILASLYEKCGSGANAEKCLIRIIKRNGGDEAMAHYRLAGVLNRLFGKSRLDEIIKNYELASYSPDKHLRAEVLVSLANFYRRTTRNYIEAENLIIEAEKLVDFDEHPEYLNVKALIHYGKKDLVAAEEAAIKGLEKRGANIDGVSESYNALGLIMMARAEQNKTPNKTAKVKDIMLAIDYFEKAMDGNLRIGSFRSCGQQCLNLIRCYAKSLEACKGEEVEEFYRLGENSFEKARYYWKKIIPNPPQEEVLQADLRHVELLIAYGNRISDQDHARKDLLMVKAREILDKVIKGYEKLGMSNRVKECQSLIHMCK